MLQDARGRADREPFLLLVTDRPDRRRSLARGITTVIPCRTVAEGGHREGRRPDVVVVDLAAEAAGRVIAETGADATGRIPSLVLQRDGAAPLTSPLSRSLPADAPQETILAGIFALIEVAARRDRRLAARTEAATGIVAEIFDSAALGAGLQHADTERGTEIVLDAVSEAGIGDWLATVWRHDAGVYQHTLSVAGYAAAFGARLGLARADLHRLTKAALLHDIGKARIPPEIINKTGALDWDELRLMRRHPEIGAALLEAQGGFEPEVVAVVRHHHEKLDGSGYPAGLAGDAIPDLVRLVAICDVFSALTERRSYREPISAANALTGMTRMIGHLDADLLRAFAPVVLGPALQPYG